MHSKFIGQWDQSTYRLKMNVKERETSKQQCQIEYIYNNKQCTIYMVSKYMTS